MVVILTMIINRSREIHTINAVKKWILIYGRRKTGKTFTIRNFIKYDEYFFIKGDRSVLTKDEQQISYETFIELLKRALSQNYTVVVDEFHRLGSDFFDLIHAMKKQGKLILISSTLFLSKKLISGRSPLLGIFAEILIGLIKLQDTLRTLKQFKLPKKEMVELGILLQEPIAIDYFDESKKAREIIAIIIQSSIKTIPALIGEIFVEEERQISAVYEGVLRAVAVNKATSGEISSYLFSKRLIKKDDPSIIQQYLSNLVAFGILKRIEIYQKNKFVYKHTSPLAKIYYYIDEKYNLSERKFTIEEILPIIDELVPRIVEDTIREALAEIYGLRENVFEAKDYDIDGCLLKINKLEIALEVKWGKISVEDIKKTEQNMQKIDPKRKILFVQDKAGIKFDGEVLDVGDLT